MCPLTRYSISISSGCIVSLIFERRLHQYRTMIEIIIASVGEKSMALCIELCVDARVGVQPFKVQYAH